MLTNVSFCFWHSIAKFLQQFYLFRGKAITAGFFGKLQRDLGAFACYYGQSGVLEKMNSCSHELYRCTTILSLLVSEIKIIIRLFSLLKLTKIEVNVPITDVKKNFRGSSLEYSLKIFIFCWANNYLKPNGFCHLNYRWH